MTKKAITYVEIDIPTCSLTYGTSPCTASIPTTGDNKCFNSLNTCQDTPNFDEQTTTLRFAKPTTYLDFGIEIVESCVENVSFSPATVSLGKDLGQRASVTVTFRDFPSHDVGEGLDPYVSDRAYDPYTQGSFWGKFRARHPFLRGKNLRIKRGFQGDTIDQFETYHFVIEDFNGPTAKGKFTIIAKDVLKLADGNRAQAPALSEGFLGSALTDSATSFTINPTNEGDNYGASGLLNIGGREIVSFTRSGDVFTIVRGQEDTDAVAHDADSRIQECLQYSAQKPGDIIRDLLINYANVPTAYIDQDAWTTETDSFLASVYSAIIAEPTSIKKLVSELIEQGALSLFWEPLTQKIKLKVLRQIDVDAQTFDNDKILMGSMQSKEQPNKRISQIWTYFAKTNPLLPLDEPESYRSTAIKIDTTAESNHGTSVIKKIFSRWIPLGGRSVANRLNDVQLARFTTPPRKFQFNLFHDESITLGDGYRIKGYQIQNDLGEETTAPIQVTRLSKNEDKFLVESEEMFFEGLDPINPNDHTIILDSNSNNINLKTTHDNLFGAGSDGAGVVVSVYIESGVIIGSDSTSNPAFDVGTGWDAATQIDLYVRGRIQGAGGRGGNNNNSGSDGGDALETTRAINIDFENNAGEIWSGGGGGGGAVAFQGSSVGGGGGAGQDPGNGGSSNPAGLSLNNADAGTTESGGDGGILTGHGTTTRGGDGGGPGLDGSNGSGGSGGSGRSGGSAGDAIVGVSNVTFLNDGSKDIRGAQTG